nr:hypothetical protein [Tanacetum cinerariifolium]
MAASHNINNSTLRSILTRKKHNGPNFTNWNRNLRIMLREVRSRRTRKKSQGAKGKDKGNTKLPYALKPKILPPPKIDNSAKESIRHPYKKVGQSKRNSLAYHVKLKKKKITSVANTSVIFTIELYAFPNKSWVYDTCCGTHIYNTSQGLRESMKQKNGNLSMYLGNRMRAAIEAIRSFNLDLYSGLIIVLDNCHFTPTITRGVVSISNLVENGYIHSFMNYGAAEASMEVVWMRKFINGHGNVVPTNKRPMEMLCDNISAIAIANDLIIIKGSRHYQRKYHYIREVIRVNLSLRKFTQMTT